MIMSIPNLKEISPLVSECKHLSNCYQTDNIEFERIQYINAKCKPVLKVIIFVVVVCLCGNQQSSVYLN